VQAHVAARYTPGGSCDPTREALVGAGGKTNDDTRRNLPPQEQGHNGRPAEARSVAVQEQGGRTWAEARGWKVVAAFQDENISGAAFGKDRPGLEVLLRGRW